jgi:uncharacterized protein YaaQ
MANIITSTTRVLDLNKENTMTILETIKEACKLLDQRLEQLKEQYKNEANQDN